MRRSSRRFLCIPFPCAAMIALRTFTVRPGQRSLASPAVLCFCRRVRCVVAALPLLPPCALPAAPPPSRAPLEERGRCCCLRVSVRSTSSRHLAERGSAVELRDAMLRLPAARTQKSDRQRDSRSRVAGVATVPGAGSDRRAKRQFHRSAASERIRRPYAIRRAHIVHDV